MDAPGGSSSSGAVPRYETVFTNAKAGMENVDKEHVSRVVYEMSKHSAFFTEESRRNERVSARIATLQARAATLGDIMSAHQTRADRILQVHEAARDLTRTWACVDMDAFFAACEALTDPSLRGDVPFAVGGMGMITTASYAARRYGVRSAMPGFIGVRLCADHGVKLRFVRNDHAKYSRYAQLARTVFAEFDADFIAASIDEAFIDLTSYIAQHGVGPEVIAARIREGVKQATGGLTCSVGVGPSRLLAKVCSDINKPDGQCILAPTRAALAEFLEPLPLRKLGGIGKVTERVLREAVGATTCGELLRRRATLAALLSERETSSLLGMCLGRGGEAPPEPPREGEPSQKGVSQERTFEPISSEAALREKCAQLAALLQAQLEAKGLQARTLTLKLKEQETFRKQERTITLPAHFGAGCGAASAGRVEAAALAKLEEQLRVNRNGRARVSYRLMGLRATSLREAAQTAAALDAAAGGSMCRFVTRGGNASRGDGGVAVGGGEAGGGGGDGAAGCRPGEEGARGGSVVEPRGSEGLGAPRASEYEGAAPMEDVEDLEDFELGMEEEGGWDDVVLVSGDCAGVGGADLGGDVAAGGEGGSSECRGGGVPCPVCGQLLDGDDNAALNAHVDECLTSTTLHREGLDVAYPADRPADTPVELVGGPVEGAARTGHQVAARRSSQKRPAPSQRRATKRPAAAARAKPRDGDGAADGGRQRRLSGLWGAGSGPSC